MRKVRNNAIEIVRHFDRHRMITSGHALDPAVGEALKEFGDEFARRHWVLRSDNDECWRADWSRVVEGPVFGGLDPVAEVMERRRANVIARDGAEHAYTL